MSTDRLEAMTGPPAKANRARRRQAAQLRAADPVALARALRTVAAADDTQLDAVADELNEPDDHIARVVAALVEATANMTPEQTDRLRGLIAPLHRAAQTG